MVLSPHRLNAVVVLLDRGIYVVQQEDVMAATERECLGLKHALENWSWYLLGSKFNVVLYSDHQALQALAKSKINNTRISD